MASLRKYLLAGVVALAPLLVTVALINWLIELSDDALSLLPAGYAPETLIGIDIPGLGIILALLFIITIGMLTTHFIGHHLMRLVDRIMGRIPLVRSIYKATRQLLEATLSDSSSAFQKVVMVPFPDKATMVIGFVTGETAVAIHGASETRVSVFVPSTPVPTTGWLLFVDPVQIVYLDMSVEEGMKLVLSGGTLPAGNGGKPEEQGK
ncbi:putative membrane protein [Mariprofundus ferrinatatus]|uniref:Putative membrane protein n=1 Tax=Mariprofundus ferrinatatus TaxID=1921087 RepID=A0A2K8L7D2_9PROT|nr:DUF502 domain-containing protein [Mariprofundus ferrinatatus]ATX83042.1 putative membrane protein [Mariprofundus ferrinatatus]